MKFQLNNSGLRIRKQFNICERISASILDLNTVHEIFKKTEGWPLSIKLVTKISEKKRLKEIIGDGNNPYVSDYLFHELITGLSSQEKNLLLKTSVLKVLEPEICIALTEDKDAATILSTIEKRGYFTSKMDEEKPIFQYHHRFQDFLQQELRERYTNTEVTTLFLTAAEELYKQDDYMEAIEMVLRGNHFEQAMKWIEVHATDVLKMGYTETFKRWIDLLLKQQQDLALERNYYLLSPMRCYRILDVH